MVQGRLLNFTIVFKQNFVTYRKLRPLTTATLLSEILAQLIELCDRLLCSWALLYLLTLKSDLLNNSYLIKYFFDKLF